jgi:hypothetical protein
MKLQVFFTFTILICYSFALIKANSCAACPTTFSPVCGVDGRTFQNSCFASCNGIAVASVGQCPVAPVSNPVAYNACSKCPTTFSPVCGVDGRTFQNSCFAACNGIAIASVGQCPVTPAPVSTPVASTCGCCSCCCTTPTTPPTTTNGGNVIVSSQTNW